MSGGIGAAGGGASWELVGVLAAAAGTGIIGNAAYDALKRALRGVRQRMKPRGAKQLSDTIDSVLSPDEIMSLARLAVQARSSQLGLPIPDPHAIRASLETDDTVRVTTPDFTARVQIKRPLDDVYVNIHTRASGSDRQGDMRTEDKHTESLFETVDGLVVSPPTIGL